MTKAEPVTIDWLREQLADSIRDLRSKETTPAAANAISNSTGKILASYRLQMEYYKLTGKTPSLPFLGDRETK